MTRPKSRHGLKFIARETARVGRNRCHRDTFEYARDGFRFLVARSTLSLDPSLPKPRTPICWSAVPGCSTEPGLPGGEGSRRARGASRRGRAPAPSTAAG